ATVSEGKRNHSNDSGKVANSGIAPSAKKPACQPYSETSRATSGGKTIAISPVPQRMTANASPRFLSNHRLTSWVQVIAIVPAHTIGIRKKARYNQPIEPSIWVIAK